MVCLVKQYTLISLCLSSTDLKHTILILFNARGIAFNEMAGEGVGALLEKLISYCHNRWMDDL